MGVAGSSCGTRKIRKGSKGRKSQTGGDYGFSGPAFMSAAGAPVESRLDQLDCMEVAREAPKLTGGARRSKKQRNQRNQKNQKGGACGCNQQRGGGGGTGGYSVDVTNNDLIGYAGFTRGDCAAVPPRAQYGGSRRKQSKRQQKGGAVPSAAAVYGLQSYPTGYDMNVPVEVDKGTAHYMDWTAYDNTCKGGSRRNRKQKKRN